MSSVIFLVDMNSFFISCEMTRHPEIKGKPAAVAGDPATRTGIILTANYDARKFGVKTTMPVHQALKLCPDLVLLPPDHRFYSETSRQVMDILSGFSPVVEENSIDEAWLDMTGCEGLFGDPASSAELIMNTLQTELGLPCSIGISENKFLSKMASEMKKPLGITELWRKDIGQKLWPLPVQSMYGVGKQTAGKLKAMGIHTIGDLARSNREALVKKLGKSGAELQALANGFDDNLVQSHAHEAVKSIGRSVTLAEDISDLENARKVLLRLSEEVGRTARKQAVKGRTVQISIKYADFRTITRQATIPATSHTNEIFEQGYELLRKNWNSRQPVRLLGISLSGFDSGQPAEQLSMFDSNAEDAESEKLVKLENALDSLRDKYGKSIVNRAVLMKKESGSSK
ncbi:MAG: dinB [Firmicutes bacterium]|nr:dinB [Bacillota bacterium]